MDKQPNIDRTILLPILIGTFSIFGILIILLIGRMSASRAAVSEEPTETPFKYIFLGTEPLPSVEGTLATELGLFEETGTPFGGFPNTPQPPLTLAVTPTRGTPNATSGLPTSNQTGGPPGSNDGSGPPVNNTSPAGTNPGSAPPPLGPGTYDDTHSYLASGPDWHAQANVPGAYLNTLHVSQGTSGSGSSVTFSFIGNELRLKYLGDASYGEVRISIDTPSSTGVPLDQSDLSSDCQTVSSVTTCEWVSNLLANGTHSVAITHTGGGSVNIDAVIIPAVATPTPTPTRTP